MMSDYYTPTTDEVRSDYALNDYGMSPSLAAEFDRWLKTEHAKVREQVAQALDAEAEQFEANDGPLSSDECGAYAAYRDAARIARGQA
jgi:hypothetical protein